MVNKVILVGNVGQKPTSREVNGKTVANCTLATSMKSRGESVTEWHRLVFWDKTAELVLQYVDKGSKLYVEGRITYRKFTNKDGVEQHSTEIVVGDMKFLGDSPKKAGQDDATFTPPRDNSRGGSPAADSSEFPF
jgi:single-strand DNA-binding protein